MGDCWFTSDSHFGHTNILKYCQRPFADIDEMDATIIDNWNQRVKPGDTIFHLGDFALCRPERALEILSLLNGEVHLIRGNHDRSKTIRARFIEVVNHRRITICGKSVILEHHPLPIWDGMKEGVWHFHGHSHGKSAKKPHRVDVGVDVWGFKPISAEEAMAAG